jgi:hypothetical protein
VTGAGHVAEDAADPAPYLPVDPAPYLRVRKSVKFMGAQDRLAVVAAGRALEGAGLRGQSLGPRTGLYLAVGYLPFEQDDIDHLIAGSCDEAGALSMRLFSTRGYTSVNPLITFRCLSNMPAYHVSTNFDIQGPYLVTYPGPGQFYLALEAARDALAANRVDRAVVGGVAQQRNFLVQHHFRRIEPPVAPERLADTAACLVLERSSSAEGRARLRLEQLEIRYARHHPFEEARPPHETPEIDGREHGPASLPLLVSRHSGGPLTHSLESRDGIVARSTWGTP